MECSKLSLAYLNLVCACNWDKRKKRYWTTHIAMKNRIMSFVIFRIWTHFSMVVSNTLSSLLLQTNAVCSQYAVGQQHGQWQRTPPPPPRQKSKDRIECVCVCVWLWLSHTHLGLIWTTERLALASIVGESFFCGVLGVQQDHKLYYFSKYFVSVNINWYFSRLFGV